jgi:hypothetical protein
MTTPPAVLQGCLRLHAASSRHTSPLHWHCGALAGAAGGLA